MARTLEKPLMRLSIGVKIKLPLLEVGTSQVVDIVSQGEYREAHLGSGP